MDGRLQADPKKFPSGLKSLSDKLAGMGENLHCIAAPYDSELLLLTTDGQLHFDALKPHTATILCAMKIIMQQRNVKTHD